MAIPKIIHQTDKSNDVRKLYSYFREGLLSLHPGWEYKFYDDQACRKAVEEYFPALLGIYDRASVIQRTDIFRIIIVYGEGGFYLDMDTECLNLLDDLCEFRCVFGEELIISEEEAQRLGHRDWLRVGNFMFGSEAGHPLLLHILREMAEESRREVLTENDVLESTGPGLVTTVYHDLRKKLRDVVLLRNNDRTCLVTGGVSCHFGNYARHHHEGSWRWAENGKVKPAAGSVLKRPVGEEERKRVYDLIDSRICKISAPDDIYVLRTYNEKPDDGLTYVLNRASGIGVLTEDTGDMKGEKVLICGMPPSYTGRISGKNTNIVYTTFESTELPRLWARAMNKHYDYCIVPHPHISKVFESSGVKIPIKVIHQGFTRHKRKYRESKIGDIFRIGFLGVPYERKNLFKLYQACVNLYAEIPGLRLAVHVAKAYSGMFTPQFALVKHTPFVEWTEGRLTEDEISKWYGRLSCLVFPSSGEGWSFTPRESMYLGIPTVLTDIPVHRDLTVSGFYKEIPVSGKEDAVFEGKVFGEWDRVSVEEIENSIRDLYQNYGNYYIKALQGSRWIENKWTNESAQQRLLEFINSL